MVRGTGRQKGTITEELTGRPDKAPPKRPRAAQGQPKPRVAKAAVPKPSAPTGAAGKASGPKAPKVAAATVGIKPPGPPPVARKTGISGQPWRIRDAQTMKKTAFYGKTPRGTPMSVRTSAREPITGIARKSVVTARGKSMAVRSFAESQPGKGRNTQLHIRSGPGIVSTKAMAMRRQQAGSIAGPRPPKMAVPAKPAAGTTYPKGAGRSKAIGEFRGKR